MPETTGLLIRRLRDAADELESAARYGLTVPPVASVNGYDNLEGLQISLATVEEFDAWADYAADVDVVEYEHDGRRWRRGAGTLGLEWMRVEFAVFLPTEVTS